MTTKTETRVEELEAELKEAVERAEKAEAEAEQYRPTADVSGFFMEDAEDVRARFGKQKLEDIAHMELAQINRHRAKQNLPMVKLTGNEKKQAVEKVVQELLEDRKKEGPKQNGPIPKTLKMVKPDGTLVQLPYEAQINNLAGSLEDAVARYRNKGYKLTDPTLCPAQNCYEEAAMDNGKFAYGAYCSQDHQRRTEQMQGTPVSR